MVLIWTDYMKYKASLREFDPELGQEGTLLAKTKMIYFEKEAILHLAISEELESNSLELSPTA